MPDEMDAIEREIPQDAIRVCVAGTNMAVALTGNQVVIGRTGLTSGEEVRRYPLAALTAVRCVRDARGDLLALEFYGVDSCVGLFPAQVRDTVEGLVALLDCPIKKVVQFDSCAHPSYAAAA